MRGSVCLLQVTYPRPNRIMSPVFKIQYLYTPREENTKNL